MTIEYQPFRSDEIAQIRTAMSNSGLLPTGEVVNQRRWLATFDALQEEISDLNAELDCALQVVDGG